MSQVKFPQNAPDGTIFEATTGIFYQYNKRENAWIKVDGFAVSEDPATPLKNGLMSKEDLAKLEGLLLPPPKTSLTSNNCTFTFDSGVFGFRSSKEHLFIDHELSLYGKDEKGFVVEQKEVWRIHENTYGINFRLNLPSFVSELESRGSLSYRKTIGPRGPKGDPGTDGIDELETGPEGTKGDDGANMPFSGFLAEDQLGFLSGDGNRGIIDITNEKDGNDQYLTVTRSIIGNPDLCPKLVKPVDFNSKWLLVVDERPIARQILDDCDPTICGVSACGANARSSIVQSFCSTRLYYLDMLPIEAEIRARFDELLIELKTTKEQVVIELMKSMIDLFTEQKLALCCAIENCESRRENQRHRNIIDGERIQAAQAGRSIYVDGEDVRNYVDTDPDKDCPPSEDELQAIDNEQISDGEAPVQETCLTVYARSHNTESSSARVELEAGDYSVRLDGCCFFTGLSIAEDVYTNLLDNPNQVGQNFNQLFTQMTPFNSRMVFYYQGPEGEVRVDFPDTGNFRRREDCESASCDYTFEFTHLGGEVRAYYSGGDTERTKFEGATIIIGEEVGDLPRITEYQVAVETIPTLNLEELTQLWSRLWQNRRALEARREATLGGRDMPKQFQEGELIGIREINTRISQINMILSIVHPRMIELGGNPMADPSSMLANNGPTEIPYRGGFIDSGQSDICMRLQVQEEGEGVGTSLDDPVRENCEEGFEVQKQLAAEVNSVQTLTDPGNIDEEPRSVPLEPDVIYEDQTGRPIEVELSSGTYDIEVLGGSFYDAEAIEVDVVYNNPPPAENANFTTVCPNGCWIARGEALAYVPPGGAVYPGWEVVPPPDNPDAGLPETQVVGVDEGPRSSKGLLLITQGMYDAAIEDDSDKFYSELILSGEPINPSADPIYDGFVNHLIPDDVSINILVVMEQIRTTVRAYNSVVTFAYNGYLTSDDRLPTRIMQSIRPLGGFYTANEAEEVYVGQRTRITLVDTGTNTMPGSAATLNIFYHENNEFGGIKQPAYNPNRGNVSLRVVCVDEKSTGCEQPVLTAKLDCRYRNREPNALMVELDAGNYVMSVTDCCCLGGAGYSGRIALKHQGLNGETLLTNPDLGAFIEEEDAENYYVGNSFSFQHLGGDVKMWIPQSNHSGVMEIEIVKKECLEEAVTGTAATDLDPAPEYGTLLECDMPLEHINFYQFGWKSGACCGALVEYGGVKWIVVKRSIGTDTTCGGGESLLTDCIRKGLEAGVHPAIAYPTLDGKLFLGKPSSGFQRFFRIDDLETNLLGLIKDDKAIRTVNKPEDNIDTIMFPFEPS